MPRIALILAVFLASCGKDDPATGDSTPTGLTTGSTSGGTTPTPCNITEVPPVVGDPLTVDLAGECPLSNRWGDFAVSVYDIYSIVAGDVANGVVPITVLEEVGRDGTCVLLRRNNPFCDPPCASDQTCDFDGTCVPYPENQDLGTVTIGGLEADVIMQPIQPGNNYFNTQMPHPAFTPGSLIELTTGCGVYDQVVLHGVGVEPVTLTSPDWVVRDGEDLPISWNAPTVPINPGQHVQVRLNIDQHGNTPVQMFCSFPDTGTASLPASLVDQLMAFGVTGFPNATLTRRTVDSATLSSGGCIDFSITSPVDPNVLVDGFIPCIPGGNTCPTGMTCDPYIGLCE